MVERTLVDEIISIIHSEANNNPLPLKCTIHETYPNGLIDVLLENGTKLTYLPVIGSPRVGDTGVLLYLDDEKNNQIIITNGGSSGGGEVDLSNYIQKSSITGLVKNDGSIDSNDYVTSQELPSKTSDLINDSSFTTLEAVYPVGSIYMSVNTVSPSVLFGFGVWEKIEDKFLLGCGTTYADGSTGGSADSVVVSHNHTQNSHKHIAPANRKFVLVGNGANWSYTSQIKIRTDGSGTAHYYPHSNSDTGGVIEYNETAEASPTINSTGEDGTGKNMPPYIAVNIWKRTA